MWKDKLYISVDSANFWWGVHGLTSKVGWEDITIYDKLGNDYRKVVRTCISTKKYLHYCLEELKDEDGEEEYVNDIKNFLSDNAIQYHYYYDNPKCEDFYEVPFEAKRNEIGVKPSYIEVWHPSEGVDIKVLEECAKAFLKKFLDIDIGGLEFKNDVSFEEAFEEYIEEMEMWNQIKEISFSDELIEKLMKEWNSSKEKVLETLYRSIKCILLWITWKINMKLVLLF